jgi:hypothetical protein
MKKSRASLQIFRILNKHMFIFDDYSTLYLIIKITYRENIKMIAQIHIFQNTQIFQEKIE